MKKSANKKWCIAFVAMLISCAGLIRTQAWDPNPTPGSSNGSDPANNPVITSIEADAKTVSVTVTVPASVRQVTLESRTRLGAGTWAPRAVQRVNGAGTLTFKLDKSPTLEVLRVRGDAQEPLPDNFFLGKTNFNGQTSAYDPSLGSRGIVIFAAGPGGVVNDTTAPTADSSRTVVESDIWKIQGNTLYFFNQYRGLQVIDITQPDAPVILGTLELPAAGEQMYLLDDQHVILLAAGTSSNGTQTSQVLVVKVTGKPEIVKTLPLQGSISESRLVGTALYVASDTYREVVVPPNPDKPGVGGTSQ
jgi:hypothetical protein